MPKSCWPVSKGRPARRIRRSAPCVRWGRLRRRAPGRFPAGRRLWPRCRPVRPAGFRLRGCGAAPAGSGAPSGAGAVRLVGFAVHAREECVADLRTGETAVDAVFRHRFFRDLFPGAPCAKPLRIAVAGVCTADPRQEQHECREPFHLPGRITALRAVPRATRRATRNRRAGSGSSLPWQSLRRCRS